MVAPAAQHRRLLADIARAYYLDESSKVEIAKDFGLSRFQVARLLREARDSGVVTITVEVAGDVLDERGRALASQLGLRQVLVVDDAGTTSIAETMGRAALAFVDRSARPGMRIGISWSRTLDAAAAYWPALPPCTVVQLAGALRTDADPAGSQSVFSRLGGDPSVTVFPLYAPLMVTEAETARDLLALPEITGTLEAASGLDLALVSVGAWAHGQSTVWQKCSPHERQEAADAGAVAEVSGRLIAADGSAVPTLDERIVGVSLDQLRQAQTTAAVAHGGGRAEALKAAAASGMIDVAIIDTALEAALAALLSTETSPAR